MTAPRASLGPFGFGSVLLSALLGCSSSSDVFDTLEPPSAVILISMDTVRADYLNFHGYTEHETTPFLDTFAAESFVFENSICVEPFTLTSHMSLLTGLYPQNHGVGRESQLHADVQTLAEVMKEGGYATQAFADGGWMRDRWGLSRGFDNYTSPKRRGFGKILIEARNWLEEREDEKLFLFLHTYDVHNWGIVPFYQCPPEQRGSFSSELKSPLNTEDMARFKRIFKQKEKRELTAADKTFLRSRYAEGIRFVDGALATFFDYLKESGIYERALIIVWSDHGEGLYDHGQWEHDEMYEHTIRTPLVVHVPGLPGNGRRVQSVVSTVDIAPTILELTGLPSPMRLDGRSFRDYLIEDPVVGEAFTISVKHELFSLRTPGYHLFFDVKEDRYHFFDVASDPEEKNDLWPSESTEATLLKARLTQWIDDYESARRSTVRGDDAPVDAETAAELKALGYAE